MLTIQIPRIPPEGLEIDEPLSPEGLHVEEEGEFGLRDEGRLRCRVELGDDDSVHVRGRLRAGLELECGRCLDRFPLAVEQELDLFFLPRPGVGRGGPEADPEEEVPLSDRDLLVSYYSDEELDLGDVIREQLFLALPMKRTCSEGCRGLCHVCGKNLNRERCECGEAEEIDPRLSPLKELLERKR